MSDMKCPFCQQELESVLQLVGTGGLVEEAYLLCSKCNIRGERKLWQELIRTRKALDVAKDKLDTVRQYHRGTAVIRPDDIAAYCDRAIEQITALEQKDK